MTIILTLFILGLIICVALFVFRLVFYLIIGLLALIIGGVVWIVDKLTNKGEM